MIVRTANRTWNVRLLLKGKRGSHPRTIARPRATKQLINMTDNYVQRSLKRVSVQKYVAGLDEFIPLLDRLALIFAVVEHQRYQPISILLLRALEDFQVGIFLTLCQVQGDVVELMRDVLEIELLIREFKHDQASMKTWVNSDPERRKNLYSANALRQRHANRIGVNAKDLPDASDYKLHSQALHISPLSHAPPLN
jgi:hypothetical protein